MTATTTKTPAKDAKAITRKGDMQKGAALATLCVNFAQDEARAEEARGVKRLRYVKDIKALSPDGHSEFRAQLQNELAALTELEKEAGMDASRHGGYSIASYRVMVSNWRTVSVACQAGMEIADDAGNAKGWETILDEARAVRKAQQSNGNADAADMRAQGQGRKAKTAYEKVWDSVIKLDKKDQRKLLTMLAASFGQELVAKVAEEAEPKAAKVKPAGRMPKAETQQAAVLH